MKFAEIVRSSPMVRTAFAGAGLHAVWWRLILALHGKPVANDPTSAETRETLAQGFRFYGKLYVALSVTQLVAATTIGWAGLPGAWFWMSLLVGSAVYLLATCHLAFRGADLFLAKASNAAALLVTFFVSVVAYLCFFCGACSVLVFYMMGSHQVATLIAIAAVLIFGVGSYLIEILFLITSPRTAAVT